MQTRLPKTKRAPEAFANARITERSLRIINVIARYRFVLARDIVRVVGGNEDVTHRHLQQLFHRDLISRFALPLGENRGEFVYFLDNTAALRKLCQSSRLSAERFDWDEIGRNRQKYGTGVSRTAGQYLFIEHELMISRFHADVEASCRADGSVVLDRWDQGAALWNTVQLDSGRILPHRPDALLTLKFLNAPEGQQRATFLYEADRETSSLARIRDKMIAHIQFLMQAKQAELLGFRKVRAVLIETLSEDRVAELQSLTLELAERQPISSMLFWMSQVPHADRNSFLHARCWRCSNDDRLRALSE